MRNTSQELIGRTQRYTNVDGTGEMGMGLMYLAFTLSSGLQAMLPAGSSWRNGFGSMLLMFTNLMAMVALSYWATIAIKEHITWPRTGYAAYRRGAKSAFAAFVLSLLVAGAAVGLMLVARRYGSTSVPRLLMLVAMVLPYGVFIYRMGREHPWRWLVWLLMVLGIFGITLVVRGDVVKLFRPVGLFVGIMWLASGAGTLYSYIRHTEPPAQEAE